MPESLLLFLIFLALTMVFYCAYRWGNSRGYDAGYNDSLEIGQQVDDILQEKYRPPPRRYPDLPRPPKRPTPPSL